MKNILFIVSDGVGNQICTIPAFLACRRKHPRSKITVYNILPTNAEATKIIYGKVADDVLIYGKDRVNRNLYIGQYIMYPMINKVSALRILNATMIKQSDVLDVSEVTTNIRAVLRSGDRECIEIARTAFDHIARRNHVPDILLHDGYSKNSKKAEYRWTVKSFPHYQKVAERLKKSGYTVGSIGAKSEYIKGTVDCTGLSLTKTISTIKGTKLLIANDTSTYHLANLLKKKNIVLFTCTSIAKNFHAEFHKYSTVMRREDLECSPCHVKGKEAFYWLKNKEMCQWKCRQIPSRSVVRKAVELLGG